MLKRHIRSVSGSLPGRDATAFKIIVSDVSDWHATLKIETVKNIEWDKKCFKPGHFLLELPARAIRPLSRTTRRRDLCKKKVFFKKSHHHWNEGVTISFDVEKNKKSPNFFLKIFCFIGDGSTRNRDLRFFCRKKIFFVDWKKTCRAENFNLKWHRWLENKTVKWSSCYRSYVLPCSYEDVRAATENSSITKHCQVYSAVDRKKMFHWPTWRLFIWINQARS